MSEGPAQEASASPVQPGLAELSVFFPAYNEESNIRSTLEKAMQVLPRAAETYEAIVVNDGSTDRTAEVVRQLALEHPQIRMISHEPNRGYGEALRTGFYNAKYAWVAFMDSDGQFDFSEIAGFISAQRETGADLVIGCYRRRAASPGRKLNTWLWRSLVSLLFGLKAADPSCGFKLIRRSVIERMPRLESGRGAFISSELLVKAEKMGFRIVELPVSHYPRTAGKSTGADLKVIVASFIDLFRLWKKLR